jgi:ribosomal-protein-alanine N-acetyltransferase
MTEFPRLETERLILREYQSSDLDDFSAIYADSEVVRFLAQGQTRSREECAERMATTVYRWNQYRLPQWAVTLKTTDRWLGRCGFQPKEDDAPAVVELAYAFARWTWGHGYATEAARACIDYVFDVMGWDQVVARARPGNHASLRVLEKLGFVREGLKVGDDGASSVMCVLTRRPSP